MNAHETGWECVDWINVDQDRDTRRAYVKAVMNLRVPWQTNSEFP